MCVVGVIGCGGGSANWVSSAEVSDESCCCKSCMSSISSGTTPGAGVTAVTSVAGEGSWCEVSWSASESGSDNSTAEVCLSELDESCDTCMWLTGSSCVDVEVVSVAAFGVVLALTVWLTWAP